MVELLLQLAPKIAGVVIVVAFAIKSFSEKKFDINQGEYSAFETLPSLPVELLCTRIVKWSSYFLYVFILLSLFAALRASFDFLENALRGVVDKNNALWKLAEYPDVFVALVIAGAVPNLPLLDQIFRYVDLFVMRLSGIPSAWQERYERFINHEKPLQPDPAIIRDSALALDIHSSSAASQEMDQREVLLNNLRVAANFYQFRRSQRKKYQKSDLRIKMYLGNFPSVNSDGGDGVPVDTLFSNLEGARLHYKRVSAFLCSWLSFSELRGIDLDDQFRDLGLPIRYQIRRFRLRHVLFTLGAFISLYPALMIIVVLLNKAAGIGGKEVLLWSINSAIYYTIICGMAAAFRIFLSASNQWPFPNTNDERVWSLYLLTGLGSAFLAALILLGLKANGMLTMRLIPGNHAWYMKIMPYVMLGGIAGIVTARGLEARPDVKRLRRLPRILNALRFGSVTGLFFVAATFISTLFAFDVRVNAGANLSMAELPKMNFLEDLVINHFGHLAHGSAQTYPQFASAMISIITLFLISALFSGTIVGFIFRYLGAIQVPSSRDVGEVAGAAFDRVADNWGLSHTTTPEFKRIVANSIKEGLSVGLIASRIQTFGEPANAETRAARQIPDDFSVSQNYLDAFPAATGINAGGESRKFVNDVIRYADIV